ncbi:MAG: autotransporter assembly complex family protein [Thiogranum sp.]
MVYEPRTPSRVISTHFGDFVMMCLAGSLVMRISRQLLVSACLTLAAFAYASESVDVQITGIEDELLNNVTAQLGIAQLVKRTVPVPLPSVDEAETEVTEAMLRRLHRAAPADIRAALQPFGYYSPSIKSNLVKTDQRWVASYQIDPGEPTRIENVELGIQGDGRNNAELRNVLESTQLASGERLQHSHYEDTKAALIKAALAAGYLDAGFSRSEIRVDPRHSRAEITLKLDTGPRYYFGDIRIDQQILDPSFISGFVKIERGMPFNTEKLLALQLALDDSGFFSRVEVDIQRKAAEDFHIPILIKTEAAKKWRFGTGLGFGTDTGPRLTLAAERRRINRHGHSIVADSLLSGIKQSIGAQYKIPIGNLVSDRLVLSSTATWEDVADDGESRRITLGINRNERWLSFQRQLYIRFEREDFSIGEDDEIVNYFIPGVTLSYLKADNVLFPRRGYSWSADIRGAAALLVSDTTFTRAEATGRAVFPLAERARALFRLQAGGMAVEDFAQLPTTERFYAGGDRSVRGYKYQTLGPSDESGNNIGGRYLLTSSAEVDYLFWKKWGGAVFIDAGNADDDFPPNLEVGAGVGLRWQTPVGMLRVDVAHPFTNSDDNLRLHISIGPDL